MAPLPRACPGSGRSLRRAGRRRACGGLVAAAVAAAALGPGTYSAARAFTGSSSSPATASRTAARAGPRPLCPRARPSGLARGGAATACAAAEGGAEAASSTPDGVPLWLDVRVSRMAKALGSLGFAKAQSTDARPDVKQSMKELLAGLREKFTNIGMPQPQGKVVDGVLVEEQYLESVIEEVKDLGLPVYTAARNIEGVKLPGGALFVRDAATQLPVGALEAPPIQYSASQSQRQTAQDVWSIVPKEEPSPEEVAEQEAIMKRYKEGLENNDVEYVPPPMSRIRELMGVATEEDCLQVEKGQVLAKIIPPNPLLWARAIMQRRKEAGSGVPSYRLRSDSEAVGPSP